ncbi:MAG: prepilin-type N-terminal cleavage/methylation domain-containing protein [Verrucomicrobiaceae bacterium]
MSPVWKNRSCIPAAAFTLLELLVVIVIITIALSILGMSTAQPDVGRRLNWGAQFLSGKMRETRGVAAMRLSNARLLVHANPMQPELMWQSFVIVAETEIGSGVWEPVGDPQRLPAGICWVPPTGAAGWSGPLSAGGKPVQISTRIGPWLEGSACWAYEFTPSSRIENRRYDLILAEGSTMDGVGVLRNPQSFRGMHVNAYGHVSEIADMAQIR